MWRIGKTINFMQLGMWGAIGEGKSAIRELLDNIAKVQLDIEESKKRNEYFSALKDRCEKLGYGINYVVSAATVMNTDIEHVLELLEQMPTKIEEDRKRIVSLSLCFEDATSRNLYVPEPEEEPGPSEAWIKKQLKYEKNPVRIKQLNIMLNKKRKSNRRK